MSTHQYRLAAPPETTDDDPPVHLLMTHRLVAIVADANADIALRLLDAVGAHHLLVMAGPRCTGVADCVGLVDEADLLRGAAAPDGPIPVGLLARRTPTVAPDDRRATAARVMRLAATDAALVTDGERLLGIVTAADIVHSVAGSMPDRPAGPPSSGPPS